MEQPLTTRIAPTPSGFLHAGNALNFILTAVIARKHRAQIRLRIDDLDRERVRNEYLTDIFETGEWLGIAYDQGPANIEDHLAHFSQHLRLSTYEDCIRKLIVSGNTFTCNCSRSHISLGLPCLCKGKNLPADMPDTAIKMDTAQLEPIEFTDEWIGRTVLHLHETMPDFIIRRKNGLPAYQVASLCDDLLYETGLIVRGIDLLPSTGAQLMLSRLLGKTGFEKTQFYHHPLLLNADRNKLSKTAGDVSIRHMREREMKPAEFYLKVSSLLQCPEATSLNELSDAIDLGALIQLNQQEWVL